MSEFTRQVAAQVAYEQSRPKPTAWESAKSEFVNGTHSGAGYLILPGLALMAVGGLVWFLGHQNTIQTFRVWGFSLLGASFVMTGSAFLFACSNTRHIRYYDVIDSPNAKSLGKAVGVALPLLLGVLMGTFLLFEAATEMLSSAR